MSNIPKAKVIQSPSPPGIYWEVRVVQWNAVTDENGDVWKIGDEEIMDIRDSGVEGLDVSDAWQVMN